MTKKVCTAPGTERGNRLYDLSALTKIAPMFQIEDCCYVVFHLTALRSQDIKRTVLYGTVFGLLYEQHDERTDERFSGDTSEVSHFRFNP
ncbi:hypothetical protein ACNDRL_004726, partial [Escherichia coli]